MAGIDELVGAIDATAPGWTWRPAGRRRAATRRWPTSPSSTASAELRAAGGARAARKRLEAQPPGADVPTLVHVLEDAAR
ncbi:MAG: hypothetical protein R2736_15245 [Solirubrobacterales bacterium]